MATVSVSPQTFNVAVLQVTGTNSTGLGSAFNVGSLAPVTDTALASPGVKLTVDIQAENPKGVANSLTVAVTDPSGSNGFFGQGTITWDDGDSGVAWIEFTGFPLQADQVTDTGECGLSLQTSSEDAAVRVFTE
ncbi:hypothetical protein ACKI1I_28850 [Streptomyces turgidiscabies]|uniref:Uncharacterized protein n=1 Tax=Streptomyces turgidiscabies (strain Car8) TaxID=698760 RepID=L7ERX6_STRT8|nr:MULTISPECIES: hypothetical protein [Streptomyces]ELP62168.1 hypothetical protein STRTUCAR8_00209 [Streptomyces turgidiscabies Car8]MDX3498141.1 hypothetical protein [Streptomyces turgidiscabies]GAQ75114.1 hypothetical protein T45_06895 [Streptomyces turgidiscabies]